jgi:hypothetical protein
VSQEKRVSTADDSRWWMLSDDEAKALFSRLNIPDDELFEPLHLVRDELLAELDYRHLLPTQPKSEDPT